MHEKKVESAEESMGVDMIKFIQDERQKEEITDSILKQLPDWFGLPESVDQYVRNIKGILFFR